MMLATGEWALAKLPLTQLCMSQGSNLRRNFSQFTKYGVFEVTKIIDFGLKMP